jgi:hypothetical protein
MDWLMLDARVANIKGQVVNVLLKDSHPFFILIGIASGHLPLTYLALIVVLSL